LVPGHNVEQAQLLISLFTHSDTGFMGDCFRISNCYIIHYAGAQSKTQAQNTELANLFNMLPFPDGH
jgi:hypothetical protein